MALDYNTTNTTGDRNFFDMPPEYYGGTPIRYSDNTNSYKLVKPCDYYTDNKVRVRPPQPAFPNYEPTPYYGDPMPTYPGTAAPTWPVYEEPDKYRWPGEDYDTHRPPSWPKINKPDNEELQENIRRLIENERDRKRREDEAHAEANRRLERLQEEIRKRDEDSKVYKEEEVKALAKTLFDAPEGQRTTMLNLIKKQEPKLHRLLLVEIELLTKEQKEREDNRDRKIDLDL